MRKNQPATPYVLALLCVVACSGRGGEPDASETDIEPMCVDVVQTTPADGQSSVPPLTRPTLVFDRAVGPSWMRVELRATGTTAPIAIRSIWQDDRTLQLLPYDPLPPSRTHTLSLLAGDQLCDSVSFQTQIVQLVRLDRFYRGTPKTRTEIDVDANGTILAAQHFDAGDDETLGTPDDELTATSTYELGEADVEDRVVLHHASGSATRFRTEVNEAGFNTAQWLYYEPGPDGVMGTLDDMVTGHDQVETNARGWPTRLSSYGNSYLAGELELHEHASLSYDASGRLLSHAVRSPGMDWVLGTEDDIEWAKNYAWDLEGRLESMTLVLLGADGAAETPDLNTYTTLRDSVGRTTGLEGDDVLQELTWSRDGRLTQLTQRYEDIVQHYSVWNYDPVTGAPATETLMEDPGRDRTWFTEDDLPGFVAHFETRGPFDEMPADPVVFEPPGGPSGVYLTPPPTVW